MKNILLAIFLSVALIGCSDDGSSQKQSAADIQAGKAIAEKSARAVTASMAKGPRLVFPISPANAAAT